MALYVIFRSLSLSVTHTHTHNNPTGTLLKLERDALGVDLSSSIETSLSVPSVLSSSSWSALGNQQDIPSSSSSSSKLFPLEIRVESHPDVSYVGIYIRQLDMLNGKCWYEYLRFLKETLEEQYTYTTGTSIETTRADNIVVSTTRKRTTIQRVGV